MFREPKSQDSDLYCGERIRFEGFHERSVMVGIKGMVEDGGSVTI